MNHPEPEMFAHAKTRSGSIGASNQASSAPHDVRSITQSIGFGWDTVGWLHELNKRASKIAEHLGGPIPEEDAAGKTQGGYYGIRGNLDTLVNHLHAKCMELNYQLDRISTQIHG